MAKLSQSVQGERLPRDDRKCKADSPMCVEVRGLDSGTIMVRNSARPKWGLVLDFTREEWQTFIDAVKAGEFDLRANMDADAAEQMEQSGRPDRPGMSGGPGGWQSGAHHYPDDAVLDVHPLALSNDPRPATAGEDAERLRALWSQPYVPHSDVDWVRYYIAEKWPELRAALDALTAATPAPDVASGR